MRLRLTPATFSLWLSALMVLAVGLGTARAGSARLKFEVLLVWGTNDSESPDPKHKPVEPDVKKELNKLFKWQNYFEVNRKKFDVNPGGTTNVDVSDKCALEVKELGNGTIEVSYIGKGKPVYKRILQLPKGEILVYGGNAPNSTSWFVILKRLE
jgi:hypothetical protein